MANTFSLQTDFSVAPYFDDYDSDKNFYRILFKPSLAVQARELTQLQTILQNQIDRFGSHIFEEGALVIGGKSEVNTNYRFIKISDLDTLTNTVNVEEFLDTVITGATTGVTARVVGVVAGSEAATPNTKTLYVEYSNSGSSGTTKTFLSGETITSTNGVSVVILAGAESVGTGSVFKIEEGVVFAKDYFVRFDTQAIILDKYSDTPSYKVGFNVEEFIINSGDDTTLLDPAQGSFNFAAPGADRLKLTATLEKVDLTVEKSQPDFIELLSILDGVVQRQITKTEYSIIKDELARRTYDESGNYVVRGLNINLRENLDDGENGGLFSLANGGDSTKLSVGIEPGKAYIYGYDIENLVTNYITIEKGIDSRLVEQQNITANYGNYIIVDEVVGSWNVNSGAVVSLYDTAQNKISDIEYSATSPAGNLIGTAKFKAIEYESGTTGLSTGRFKIYLYDIVMSSDPFTAVRSVYLDNASNSDGYGDVVLQGSDAVLQETEFNGAVYRISSSNVKTIRDENNQIDTTFGFIKRFDVNVGTNGTFTVSTGQTDEIFSFGQGVLNATQKRDFIVSFNQAANVTLTGTYASTSASTTIVGTGTLFLTELKSGDKILLDGNVYVVDTITNNTNLEITAGAATNASGEAAIKRYLPGDIVDFTINGSSNVLREIEVSSSTIAEFDLKETFDATASVSVITPLSKIDAKEMLKILRADRYVIINTATNAANTVGPWNLGLVDVKEIKSVRRKNGSTFTSDSEGTDVTSSFKLKSGQRDTFYGHDLLENSGLTVNSGDYFLIKLDHFVHDNSQGAGYFSVDSYPIDDVNGAANTNAIMTSEIPIYVSPVSGQEFNLRDCIDTRPSKTNTATSATVVGSATTDPATTETFLTVSNLIYTPKPNSNFVMDLSYYLSRKDIVYIDKNGIVGRVKGVSDIKPITPQEPTEAMSIAIIEVAPYPSLPVSLARKVNRPEYANKIRKIKNRVYTMRDVGVLDERISNLEYYTSLTFLEKDTLDTKILDSNGLDRFKNGIFVDPFKNHSLGDLSDPGYKIAIDRTRKELRPLFRLGETGLKVKTLTNLVQNSNLITLPFSHELVAEQPYATSTRNAAGAFFRYVGDLFLNPESDIWVDTVQLPDLNIQDGISSAELANWQNLANAWGTDWNSWKTTWSGTSNFSRLNDEGNAEFGRNITSAQTRTGTKISVGTTTSVESLGNKVVDVSVIPFMRSREIQIEASGLKPDTKMYGFFDSETVSAYMTPTNSSFVATGDEGDDIVSDSEGRAYFIFRIPNDDVKRFRTGTKAFRLTDSITNSSNFGSLTTSAEAQYTASGLTQTKQETILTTVKPQFITTTVTESRVISSSVVDRTLVNTGRTRDRGNDPIAQSFSLESDSINGIESGYFLTKIDLYFQGKDASSGVVVEIREMNSGGYITGNIVPYSKVIVKSADITVSNDSSVATSIEFVAPVFLLADTEYAFVVKPEGNNPNTVVWTARLGESDILTDAKVNSQPYAGNLFVSSNDRTYEPVSDEDMKFKLYIANFTASSGTVVFENENTDYLIVETLTGPMRTTETVYGEDRMEFTSITGGSIANTYLATGGTSGATGVVTDVDVSEYRIKGSNGILYQVGETVSFAYANTTSTGVTAVIDTITKPTGKVKHTDISDQNNLIVDIENSNGLFVVGEQIRGIASNNTATIAALDNQEYNVFDPEIGFITPNYTDISWGAKTTSSSNTIDSSFSEIVINENNRTKSERILGSYSNELNNFSGAKTLSLQGTVTKVSDKNHISPFIDTSRVHVVLIENIINNDATDEDTTGSGNALARQITKKVTLDEGQDAEDLKVFLTLYRPQTTEVKVYFKALHNEDSDVFADVTWKEMEVDSKILFSDRENEDDFKEYEYKIPDSLLTGSNDEYQYVNSNSVTFTGFKHFAVKLVLLGEDSSVIPMVKDLRCIGLQK